MKLSARNILEGTVSAVETGTVTTHVKIDIGGATVTASITNEAATDLDLKVGDKASAIIKSSDVLVGKD
ncbi:TOBE domain-containing protein [Rhodovulum sulfidophilum]|uniref:TOBE domain-containing protein n=1 Tax=Rhodovulum sulfidophilum TaxID=35806 RepID=A0A0D6B594_RHOSU|nr:MULTISPECIES: TOBE domain-containing protein [Rhodovulum]ANB33978.1 transporter [Rhodovulum sulfidophilum DSM 1374]ANB37800.1 transporter [Rhodovulum sulfidophilum]ARC88026.1 transporter [Rhodovulum sp. MB263]MBL3559665.1 TOBE domain-containing protein [Rhodovulum sulfidophilum]MBL3566666.1 TOBE domain-containing protein [Rhodovulum sulfidophilum]